jgi:hypothetical protein
MLEQWLRDDRLEDPIQRPVAIDRPVPTPELAADAPRQDLLRTRRGLLPTSAASGTTVNGTAVKQAITTPTAAISASAARCLPRAA